MRPVSFSAPSGTLFAAMLFLFAVGNPKAAPGSQFSGMCMQFNDVPQTLEQNANYLENILSKYSLEGYSKDKVPSSDASRPFKFDRSSQTVSFCLMGNCLDAKANELDPASVRIQPGMMPTLFVECNSTYGNCVKSGQSADMMLPIAISLLGGITNKADAANALRQEQKQLEEIARSLRHLICISGGAG